MPTHLALAFRLVSWLAVVAPATAQCTNTWRRADTPGTNGTVLATKWWDPDGAGPASPLLVVAGSFSIAGNQLVNNIATWDPVTATWSPLGAGHNGTVSALAVAANGDLIAGTSWGSTLLRWNGTAWTSFAPGLLASNLYLSAMVFSLVVLPNGDLVAGGRFDVAGVPGASSIARWNGSAWSALGAGSSVPVAALTVLPNGDVVAAGTFQTTTGPAVGIARWNGTAWSSMGPGIVAIGGLCTLPNGDVIAGGTFGTIGGVVASNIARWNGTSWSPLGSGLGSPVFAVVPLANGDIAAGGGFGGRIARWNGVQWSGYGTGLGSTGASSAVRTLAELPGGQLAAGGDFGFAGGQTASNIAIWNATTWTTTGSGFPVLSSGRVAASAIAPNGDVLVAGTFPISPSASSIARWNGSSWSALGNASAGFDSVAAMPNGEVIAGGWFTSVGGVAANNVARWNGTSWSALGAGLNSRVYSLLALPNGDLLAGDVGEILRWNGVAWSPVGLAINGTVFALASLPNGDVIAAGSFSQISGVSAWCIARYDGTTWSALGTGFVDAVRAVAVMPNGDVVVGGSFTTAGGVPANRVARWNGTAWSPLGNGTNSHVSGLAVLPDGDLVAVGMFTIAGFGTANGIARWNGSTWSSFGGGFGGSPDVACARMIDEGHLLTGGSFWSVDGVVSPYVARLDTTCPPAAWPSGNGCPSSGGANVLAAATTPWIGTTFVATGTGLPATALVVLVTGFAPIAQGLAPLSLAFPQAGAGCDVLVSPDILGLAATLTGTVQSSLPLPNALALVGVTFYQQMVPIEVDALGTWTSVTATNALDVTAGKF